MKIPETLEECYIELDKSKGIEQWLAEKGASCGMFLMDNYIQK